MTKYKFYKNKLGWFIDLKYWILSKGWLAMIAGADTLLDNLSKEKDVDFENNGYSIDIQVSTSPIPFYDGILERETILGLFKGALYKEVKGYNASSRELVDLLWLCPVTLWVFWKYPKKIYFKLP